MQAFYDCDNLKLYNIVFDRFIREALLWCPSLDSNKRKIYKRTLVSRLSSNRTAS